MFLLFRDPEGYRCAADSLRPRIPAYGAGVLTPSAVSPTIPLYRKTHRSLAYIPEKKSKTLRSLAHISGKKSKTLRSLAHIRKEKRPSRDGLLVLLMRRVGLVGQGRTLCGSGMLKYKPKAAKRLCW